MPGTRKDTAITRFQNRVWRWLVNTFGEDVACNKEERGLRLLEESLELAQASGVSPEKAYALLSRVYSRPPGDLEQEIGGVGVCLYALCEANDLIFDVSTAKEMGRCERNSDLIARKHRAKNADIKASGD